MPDSAPYWGLTTVAKDDFVNKLPRTLAGLLCNGRLTLETGVAFSTSDQTAKTVVYFTPYQGASIALYDGTSDWAVAVFTEKSIKLTDSQAGATTNGSPTVTGLTDTSQLIVGMEVTGTGVPGSTTIAGIVSGTSITLSQNATADGTPTLTFKVGASKMLDIFGYVSGGALKLEMAAWTNDTTRATALTLQDGVYVKSGATTRRYLGSVRTTGTAGQTEFSMMPAAAAGGGSNKLYVWNAQNRLPVISVNRDSTDSWAYTTATWREKNAATGNRINFISGLAQGTLRAMSMQLAANDNANIGRQAGVGYDSTSAIASGSLPGFGQAAAGNSVQMSARLARPLEVGLHYVTSLERSTATGTTTWYGDAGDAATFQTGLTLELEM